MSSHRSALPRRKSAQQPRTPTIRTHGAHERGYLPTWLPTCLSSAHALRRGLAHEHALACTGERTSACDGALNMSRPHASLTRRCSRILAKQAL
eukprot:6214128-Pleurochrysis_carterae.AAC.4